MSARENPGRDSKPATQPTKRRRPGRPRRSNRPVSPAKLSKIGGLWLTGHSYTEIGELIGVSRQAVSYHVDKTLKPMWKAGVQRTLGEELAKIRVLEQTGWRQFRSKEPVETHEELRHALSEGGVEGKLVERVTKTVRRCNQKAWLEVVQWCIEQRCKILGYYGSDEVKHEHGGELRVAGMTASQVNEDMLKRVTKIVKERKRYEAAVEAAKGSDN